MRAKGSRWFGGAPESGADWLPAEEERWRIQSIFGRTDAALASFGITPASRAYVHGDPSARLVRRAGEVGADVIVLDAGSHSPTRYRRDRVGRIGPPSPGPAGHNLNGHMGVTLIDELPIERLRAARVLVRINRSFYLPSAILTLEFLLVTGSRTMVAAGPPDTVSDSLAEDLRRTLGPRRGTPRVRPGRLASRRRFDRYNRR